MDRRLVFAAVAFFLGAFFLYTHSVPNAFNTVYENRRFFDSDGEFILRQFRQGKTFTHNDHLLYHVLAQGLHDATGGVPGLRGDPLKVHKFLSTLAGAAGLVLMAGLGWRLVGRPGHALAAALLIGGSAGWWFFAATIDTYLPCIAASVAALGTAMLYLRRPGALAAAALGALMGLAFLLRTDSILLLPLALVPLAAGRRGWRHAAALGAAGFLVGAVGYALLARLAYDVPWTRIPDWATGGFGRPEATNDTWGTTANLSLGGLLITFVGQLLWTVAFPGLGRTDNAWHAYDGTGWIMPLLWLGLLATALVRGFRRRGDGTRLALAIGIAWILVRTLFYCWWDPREPFLFAALSLPGHWLILLAGLAPREQPAGTPAGRWLLPAAALLLWAHNLMYLVLPLRALPS